jgi:hypothetical protein
MLIPLLLLASHAVPTPSVATTRTDTPVRVSFNEDGRYIYGDKAKVYVRAAADGYMLVLRSDAHGDIRVLSPLDPGGDQHVQAGKKYEVKGRGGREAFVAEDSAGQGVVLAAWSSTPFDVLRYDLDGHWDTKALGQAAVERTGTGTDPGARLQRVVDAMKPDRHYDYDAATYTTYAPMLARTIFAYPYPYAWSAGWWGYDPWWGRPYIGSTVIVAPRVGVRRR